MEVGAQQPQRQKEICRQQHNGQAPGQPQLPGSKGRHRADDAQRRTAVCQQIHQGNRVQLHGQHAHGNFAEPLGVLIHLFVLPAVRTVNFQGGQALDVLQKVIAQAGVLAQIFIQQLFGKLLYGHNGHGDQRHADQQHQRRAQMYGGQQHKQGQRGQQAVKQLRQIPRKIGIDLFHPLGRQHNGFGGCHRLAVVGAKSQHFLVDFSPQCALDARGSFIAHRGSPRGADDAQRNADHADGKRRGPCASSQPGPQRAAHNPGQRPHKGHIAQQAEPLAEHAPPHIPHGGGVK